MLYFCGGDTPVYNDISYGVTSGSICVYVSHMIGRSKMNKGLYETTGTWTSLDISSSQKTNDTPKHLCLVWFVIRVISQRPLIILTGRDHSTVRFVFVNIFLSWDSQQYR